MNNHQGHDNDLVGAYVLDALEPDERVSFETHLQGCAACRSELVDLQQVVGVLPLAVDLAEPPATLRACILDSIQIEVRDSAGTKPVSGLSLLQGGLPEPRSRNRLVTGLSFIAVAAAMLIVALGAYDVHLQNRVDQQQADITYQTQVAGALAQGAAVMPVQGTAIAPAASAAMVQPRGGKPAYLIVTGLPVTPNDKVYQLWLIRGGQPRSAATFFATSSGPQIVHLASPVTGFASTALTAEPGPNGSTLPTSKPLLSAKLSA